MATMMAMAVSVSAKMLTPMTMLKSLPTAVVMVELLALWSLGHTYPYTDNLHDRQKVGAGNCRLENPDALGTRRPMLPYGALGD